MEVHRRLLELASIEPAVADAIVMRALQWPDGFVATDPALRSRAEHWRPWRAYAEAHLQSRLGSPAVAVS